MSSLNVKQHLDYPWCFVASLFWNRYPNPFARHILSEDIIERRILSNGRLYTKRLLVKSSNVMPSFLRKHFPSGNNRVTIVEESLIDVQNRNIHSLTTNVGRSSQFANVCEECVYTECQTACQDRLAGCTEISRQMSASLGSRAAASLLLGRPLLAFLVRRYRRNIDHSLAGYRYVCDRSALLHETGSVCNGCHASLADVECRGGRQLTACLDQHQQQLVLADMLRHFTAHKLSQIRARFQRQQQDFLTGSGSSGNVND